MTPTVRNILGLVAGIIAGSAINYVLIILGNTFVPPPEGADASTVEGLKESIHLFSAKHFIMPLLAHAGGTLVGAFVASKICYDKKMFYAIVVGIFFLVGGLMMAFSIPAPIGFEIADIAIAYIPMAWLGGYLGKGKN